MSTQNQTESNQRVAARLSVRQGQGYSDMGKLLAMQPRGVSAVGIGHLANGQVGKSGLVLPMLPRLLSSSEIENVVDVYMNYLGVVGLREGGI